MRRQGVAPQVARHAVRLVTRGARVRARPVCPVHVFPQVTGITDVATTYGAEAASGGGRERDNALQSRMLFPSTKEVKQRSYAPATTSRRGVAPAPYYVPRP